MPNCFQLTKKGDTQASTLNAIDEAICTHFNEPVDPKYYYYNWYNTIGLMLACGRTWDEMRDDIFKDSRPEFKAIIDFLEANYTTKAWCER